jgi:hypothetical protein
MTPIGVMPTGITPFGVTRPGRGRRIPIITARPPMATISWDGRMSSRPDLKHDGLVIRRSGRLEVADPFLAAWLRSSPD